MLSIPIYTLSAMNPPVSVINKLHKIFAKIFCDNATGLNNKHWVSWEAMCYPRNEEGLVLRSFQDISKALFAKLWWIFRTSTSSLWVSFMWNKYCKRLHPVITKETEASHVWRKMILVRGRWSIIYGGKLTLVT